jgi:hypothetical protein
MMLSPQNMGVIWLCYGEGAVPTAVPKNNNKKNNYVKNAIFWTTCVV